MPREVTPPRDCQGTWSSSRTWDKVSAPCRVCGDTAEPRAPLPGSSGGISALLRGKPNTHTPKKNAGKIPGWSLATHSLPPKAEPKPKDTRGALGEDGRARLALSPAPPAGKWRRAPAHPGHGEQAEMAERPLMLSAEGERARTELGEGRARLPAALSLGWIALPAPAALPRSVQSGAFVTERVSSV